ncbi:Holliday junction ATP-dependent DNA helicase RuvA [Fundidesulfovibrio magnetotacticus]|uniref:Holliday junction branch migration complex subunit RuvA n=1 Tax=Fundidesulfovibrio magnetotacticus TaxID=2730080 RepID=A0A6V8LZL8_9BACT|nr:Holliday junction branch migration protein RuvA [Fundidesulfovibrio magnetotacticus]GFK95087.1 Holliday junction ATP-dependent DNA helicase RuvA [Fundidesulfovibrio magnetotacticus]
MIAYLRGEILEKTDKSCVVLTASGVGYELSVGAPTAAGLPARGQEAGLWVHAQTGEDGTRLFGFPDAEARRAFRALIEIPKLGPKTALAMLSCYQVAELAGIAAREDVAALSQVPGIGKKSAQRLILEIKYALAHVAAGPSAVPVGRAGSVLSDALAALTNLGYAEAQAGPVLRQVLDDEPDLDVAQAIRAGLKRIAAAKS